MSMIKKSSLLGAHTSTSKGLYNALLEGVSIGANTVQLFTANQRQWKRKPLKKDVIEKFKTVQKETGLKSIMSHASYLVNLGSPNPNVLEKSRICMQEEIISCLELNITFLNFHPGAALNESKEACLNKIIESLLLYVPLFEKQQNLTLLLETTAGQGSVIGSTFEELDYIITQTKNNIPIGVCLDTCHVFSAGYDIRTKHALENTLEKFDKIIGLSFLKALHLNDSVYDLNSKKDRHAPLGEGKIGWECFKNIMTLKITKELPKYLETPCKGKIWDPDIHFQEIKKLKEFIET